MAIKNSSHQLRIAELDGLRGVAILLVISFHYINNQLVHTPGKFINFLYKATSFGWIGVDLFFVLSGFLIGNILFKNITSPRFFKVFYMRRFLRIVPNYFLLVTAYTAIIATPYFYGSSFITGSNIIPLWSYYLMVHNFFMAYYKSMGNASMSVTWSIGIEEQFYLIFPFIIMLIKRKYLLIVLILIIIAASLFRSGYSSWIPGYVLLYCRMNALSCGILVAYLSQDNTLNIIINKYYSFLVMLLISVVCICGLLYILYNDLGPIKQTLFSIFFSVLLILSLEQKDTLFRTFLRNSILCWVGTISYSLYLFHYLILGLFHYIILGNSYIGIQNVKDMGVSIAALVTTLLFSWIIFKKIETPFVVYGKRYKY